jgi:CDGSH-type Zn-finger protein
MLRLGAYAYAVPAPHPDKALSVDLAIAGEPRRDPRGRSVCVRRCGGSATKPFCDGMHARIGFRS